MEYLNKIEVRGIVGSSQTFKVADSFITKFSLCTERSHTDREGTSVVDTTWFQVMMVGDKPPIKKGDKVYVCGRMRAQHYINHNGGDVLSFEIVAEKVELAD